MPGHLPAAERWKDEPSGNETVRLAIPNARNISRERRSGRVQSAARDGEFSMSPSIPRKLNGIWTTGKPSVLRRENNDPIRIEIDTEVGIAIVADVIDSWARNGHRTNLRGAWTRARRTLRNPGASWNQ